MGKDLRQELWGQTLEWTVSPEDALLSPRLEGGASGEVRSATKSIVNRAWEELSFHGGEGSKELLAG